MQTLAASGTVFDVVPPAITVGVTLVPADVSASGRTARIWWAISIVALTPLCGSTPAWAARPRTMSRYAEPPLRATFKAPSGELGSHTRTAPERRASRSISSRDVTEPLSSSQVSRTPTFDVSAIRRSAVNICTMPPFMSHTPGPLAIPSVTVSGHSSIVPAGQTVS
jgi:hypothetical protein